MTHLPFIVSAYAIAIVLPAIYALAAARRLRMARQRLAALDPRTTRR